MSTCRPEFPGSDTPDRFYRLLFGATLLTALYFDFAWLALALVVLCLVEGVGNLRLSLLTSRLLGGRHPPGGGFLAFDAERLWRLVVGAMLGVSYYFLADPLWFLPWFMGFAILGAGASGVCPVLIGIRSLGFR
jgi:hypothetical protein